MKTLQSKSKYLSLLLRHKPEEADLKLDDEGYLVVYELLKNTNITRKELEEIVKTDNKQRYSFSKDKRKIRANQGHSVKVNLNLKPYKPQNSLHHGAPRRSVDSIMKEGLKKMGRNYVHLSESYVTAFEVGKRRDEKPASFTIDAVQMDQDGFEFFISENNVILTDSVPVKYLTISY